jgi:hypothetical protein
MRPRWFLLGLLALLVGCAPALVSSRPLVFQASYDQLFHAVIADIVTTQVSSSSLFGRPVVFQVASADPRTGLIKAVYTEEVASTTNFVFNNFFVSTVTTSPSYKRYAVQFYVQPAEGGASLVYSTISSTGDYALPDLLVKAVIHRLERQFALLPTGVL